MSRTFKRKGKTSTFNNIKLIMTKFLQGIVAMNGSSWVVPRCPSTNPRWRTAAMLTFVECQYISTGFAQIWYTDETRYYGEMPTWLKTELEVNLHDVISRISGIMWVVFIDYRLRHIWTKFGAQLEKQTTIMAVSAKFVYYANPRWRRSPYWILKKMSMWGADYVRELQGFSLYVFESVSDEYNF